jgi:hypothetical protein
MEKTIAQNASVLIRIPIKGVPLQELVQERLIQKSHDSHTQKKACPED